MANRDGKLAIGATTGIAVGIHARFANGRPFTASGRSPAPTRGNLILWTARRDRRRQAGSNTLIDAAFLADVAERIPHTEGQMVRQEKADYDKAGREERWQEVKLESSNTLPVEPPGTKMQYDAGRQKQGDQRAGENGFNPTIDMVIQELLSGPIVRQKPIENGEQRHGAADDPESYLYVGHSGGTVLTPDAFHPFLDLRTQPHAEPD